MMRDKVGLKKQKAFTLIELMITVALIGILASIAYPSYQDSIRKSRRADATGALEGFAGAMERVMTEAGSYCDAATADAAAHPSSCGGAGSDEGSPAAAVFSSNSPTGGGTAYYSLTINTVNDTSFTLFATPIGDQANDACGTLSLTNTNLRGVTGAGRSAGDCW